MRVLLIDDHTLFRVGLEALLESRGIEVVASVGSGQECLRLVEEL
ncbi:MAG TPA: response regulator transcription factor, partial [Gammaproteobacteria bacterium]|nr:response regulator transcription factor [Gammaproteobacteria bacterium]